VQPSFTKAYPSAYWQIPLEQTKVVTVIGAAAKPQSEAAEQDPPWAIKPAQVPVLLTQ
jgi:hypothetical protein